MTVKFCLRILFLSVVWIGLWGAGGTAAFAQAQPEAPPNAPHSSEVIISDEERVEQIKIKLGGWSAILDQIEAALRRSSIDDLDLDDLRRRADEVNSEALDVIRVQQVRVDAVRRRVAELAPREGEAGSEEVGQLYAEQKTLLDSLTSVVKQAQISALRADELSDRIAEIRRVHLTRRLLTPTSSILEPALWTSVATEFPKTITSVRLLLQDWFGLIRVKVGSWAVMLVVAALFSAVVLVWPVRHLVLKRAARDPSAEEAGALVRSGSAVMIAGLASVVPIVAMLVLYRGLDLLELLPSRVDTALWATFSGLAAIAFGQGLARALIAPGRSAWRLVLLSDNGANRLMRWIFVGVLAFGLALFVEDVAGVLSMPDEMANAVVGIVSVLIAFIAIAALRLAAREREEQQSATPFGAVFLWRWFIPLLWIAALVTLVAPLFGYIHFAWFVAKQIVWSVSLLGLLHLLLIFVDDVAAHAFKGDTRLGHALRDSLAISGSAIEQIGVLLAGVLRIVLILAAGVALLAPWGVNATDVTVLLRRLVFGFEIGGFTFALSDIVIALVFFVVGLTITRGIQRWLENSYLPHTKLDIGLKTSICTTIGYVGFIVAGMVAFSFLGLDLQNIAIVAGALSVGIGFGLQSIVNNFVSGLILLAERPIKVGDWIVVGAEEGYVRKINVRATEIETFDRQTVIVPNSDLISGVVKNWMHNDTSGRIIIPVGVSYDSDPDQVRDILSAIAQDNRALLAYPAPRVYFMNFGDSSLDFQMRGYLANIDSSLTVKSELRFEIMRRFREAGIEIPFPQQDIHFRDMDRLETTLGRRSGAGASEKSE